MLLSTSSLRYVIDFASLPPGPTSKKGISAMPNTVESTQARLLIVDDKTANLDLLREMLAPLGHEIFFATSGAKALSIAASVLPDLVLLDVMMPGMDGFETCRRFKQDEALGEIPIIFVTARTRSADLSGNSDGTWRRWSRRAESCRSSMMPKTSFSRTLAGRSARLSQRSPTRAPRSATQPTLPAWLAPRSPSARQT
jgi:CheY-like chemotaxis protein